MAVVLGESMLRAAKEGVSFRFHEFSFFRLLQTT